MQVRIFAILGTPLDLGHGALFGPDPLFRHIAEHCTKQLLQELTLEIAVSIG